MVDRGRMGLGYDIDRYLVWVCPPIYDEDKNNCAKRNKTWI